jgi:hypothetical protein
MSFVGKLIHFVLERNAKNSSLDDLSQTLEKDGVTLTNKLSASADTPANRTAVGHVIGIERWGQNRLKTALGSPLVMDEYDGYRPDGNQAFDELSLLFAETRGDTLALIRQLKAAGVGDQQVLHNQMGNLTVKAWLGYLSTHANRELGGIKNK